MIAPSFEHLRRNPIGRLLVLDVGAESRREIVVLGGRALACFDRFAAVGEEVSEGHVCEVE
jgi:hypothetical protein